MSGVGKRSGGNSPGTNTDAAQLSHNRSPGKVAFKGQHAKSSKSIEMGKSSKSPYIMGTLDEKDIKMM